MDSNGDIGTQIGDIMTNTIPRRQILQAAALPFANALLPGARAQSAWPNRAVTIIAPNPAGGPADTLARAVVPGMAKALGVSVVVDNKPGAAGKIGIQALLRAPRDGYTLAVTSTTALSALPVFDKNPGYRSPDDFEPLSLAIRALAVWCIHPSVPARNLRELVSHAKANPGRLNYASFGTNSSSHLAQEDFFRQLDIRLTHVPFKGEVEGMNALLAGQVQMMMISGAAIPHIKAGKLVALATTGEKRWSALPDIVTGRETRIPELASYMYEPWVGFSTSAGVPKDVVDKLSSAVQQGLKDPSAQAILADGLGYRIVASSVAEMREAVLQDMARYHVLARSGRVSTE